MAGSLAVALVALSRIPIGAIVWQRAPGEWAVTVVAKATFVLRPGTLSLSPDQEPLWAAERPYGDSPTHGLFAPGDLVPMKARADVVLVGEAFSPGGQPVRSLLSRLVVGAIDKRVEIAPETPATGGSAGDARPLTPPDVRAPAPPEARLAGPHDARLASPHDGRPPDPHGPHGFTRIPVVCFAPLAAGSPSRRALLGPSPPPLPAEWNGQTLPPALDPSFFNAAPRDQQLRELRSDEQIVLEHLHPEHARLVATLSGVRPRAFFETPEGAAPLPMRCDTLWIDTVRSLVTLTWRGARPFTPGVPQSVLLALEPPGRSLAWEDLDRMRKSAPSAISAPAPAPSAISAAAPSHSPAASPDTGSPPPGFGRPLGHTAAGDAPAPAPAFLRSSGAVGETADITAAVRLAMAKKAALPFGGGPASGAEPPKHEPLAPAPAPVDTRPPRGGTLAFSIAAPPTATPAPAPPVPAPVMPAPAPVMSTPAAPPPVSSAPLPAAEDSPWARGASGAPSAVSDAPRGHGAAAGVAVPTFLAGRSIEPAPVPASIASPAPAPAPPPPRAPAPAVAAAPSADAVELVWYARGEVRAVRTTPAFAPLVDALYDAPLDQEIDDPDLAEDVADMEDRRELLQVLVRGAPLAGDRVPGVLADATRPDGRVVPPIVLLAGELEIELDPFEALKATLSAAAPLAGADPLAREALEIAKAYIASPGVPGAAAVAEGLATRIREAFEKKGLSTERALRTQAERALLEARKLRRCAVLGARHARGRLSCGGEPLPIFLPEPLAARLPASLRLRVRVLARVHGALEPDDRARVALHAVAVALVTRR